MKEQPQIFSVFIVAPDAEISLSLGVFGRECASPQTYYIQALDSDPTLKS